MDFIDLVKTRYSVRAYKADAVGEDDLNQVLEAVRLAPTAANHQPFQLIVIHTAGREDDIRRIYNRDWFVQAPLVICACGVPEEAWTREEGKSYLEVDVAIVMDHLILAAADIGLGTCWVANFDPEATREILGLPDGVEPIVFAPLGYPVGQAKPKIRKLVEDLVRYERW
jgi:nitroreductase